jgi:rod shape-determining protein MreC
MKRFLFFIKKTYLFALFVVLEIAAVSYYANSTSLTSARMRAATGVVTGGVERQLARWVYYFGLRGENDALLEQIARLNTEIGTLRNMLPRPDTLTLAISRADSAALEQARDYSVTTASVIANTLTRPRNLITLDKGALDGVEKNMAVVTPEGTIVGYVMAVRERTSVAISMLNTEFRTSGRIRGNEFLGSVRWSGRDPDRVTLSEMPKYTEFTPGDTVITDYSSRFPTGVVIGTVESARMTEMGYYDVTVRVATRFSALRHVLLVRYRDIDERLELEEYSPE